MLPVQTQKHAAALKLEQKNRLAELDREAVTAGQRNCANWKGISIS